jgi:hypothetical protein
MAEENSGGMWTLLIVAAVLIIIYLNIKKPPTTLPKSAPSNAPKAVTCAPPSGDTFPSNLPTVAPGIPQPKTTPITPCVVRQTGVTIHCCHILVGGQPLHAITPVDAPPPFSLIKSPLGKQATYGMPHYGHCV